MIPFPQIPKWGAVAVRLGDLLVPDLYVASIFDLDLEQLRHHGLRGFILDLDNTLVEWGYPEPTEPLRRWVERLRGAGFRACIVSNNSPSRVQAFARSLSVPGIDKAVKPRRGAYRRAMALMGTGAAETAVVGDQIFTDILGGKRLGLYTVLVAPVSRTEFLGTRLTRMVEGAWLRHLMRRGRLAAPTAPEGASGRDESPRSEM